MRRLGTAALGLLCLAVMEVAGLALAVRLLGFGPALLLMLATSLLGGWLLRREGARAWHRFRAAAQAGRPPGGEAARGVVGLVAALLLAVPGFITDLVGLALLAPPIRAMTVTLVCRLAEQRLSPAVVGDLFGPRRVRVRRPPTSSPPTVVEGEIVD